MVCIVYTIVENGHAWPPSTRDQQNALQTSLVSDMWERYLHKRPNVIKLWRSGGKPWLRTTRLAWWLTSSRPCLLLSSSLRLP